MKNIFLPLVATVTLGACHPLTSGDDIALPACAPHQINLTNCHRENNTKVFQLYLTQNFQ